METSSTDGLDHIEILDGTKSCLRACLCRNQLLYVHSPIPGLAGLSGGRYESPQLDSSSLSSDQDRD